MTRLKKTTALATGAYLLGWAVQIHSELGQLVLLIAGMWAMWVASDA